MATLRACAASVREEVGESVCWLVLWKTGRSWNVWTFYPEEYDDTQANRMTVSAGDAEKLRNIIREDANAVLLNGYVNNIGCSEDGDAPRLCDFVEKLRWQYEEETPMLDLWNFTDSSNPGGCGLFW